ncbi:DUF2207 domain-containing protein [Aerococcus viridans]|uniref:DUF2207 domain-containing protein n=1 Tax=Aerococcus viridans TaxID=1377 RepID=A0A2J9PN55_9LACT|nr:DUF2207 domain-containing protein [Aerococcus viridans]MCT1798736.1 DUF2207 domain-containing protein [Aerococcus viridans]PNL91765.1 hypothetical protein A6J77_005825 [Aerococcus viridans]
MFQNYQEKVSNYWHKLTIIAVSLIALFFLTGYQTAVQAVASVSDYTATVNVQADGTMQQEETISFDVKGTVEEFNHRIALTDMSKLANLGVDMKSVSADSYFTFVESDSNEVGTFTVSTADDQVADITIYNTVTAAPHITQVSATISDAWTNYSEWSILKNSFLALPYDVDQATLTVTFPQAVPEDQSDLIISGPGKTDLQWADDRKSFTITVKNLKADDNVALQMYMPVSILPDNQKVGADSEGQSTIESMQASQEAATRLQRRQTMKIWAVAGTLFVLIFAYTIYLYMKKRQIVIAVPNKKGFVESQPNAYGPQTVARLMGKGYSDHQKIVLLVLEMIQAKVLAAHFEVNKKGQLADIQVSILKPEVNQPAGQFLLSAIQNQSQTSRDVVSLNDLVFNKTGKVTMMSRFGRKLVRKINQAAKQPLTKDGVYSKMNQVYMAILTLYMVAWLFGTGFVIYWQLQLQALNVWASLLLFVSVALVALLQKNVLPMRSDKGVSLFKLWQGYLKGIGSQLMNPDAWGRQSAEWLDHQYLYAWVAGSNVKVAKALEQEAQVVQLPLMGSAQAIDHLQLEKLKWQPQAEEVSDDDVAE